MSALRTLLTAVSASGLLPWIFCALLAAFGVVGAAGVYAGHHWAAMSCETQKLASNVVAEQRLNAAVAKAQATSDKIWDIGITLNSDLAMGRERAVTRTKEVTRYVDASPDLARTVVPADVQRVRDEQVRDSESVAAPDRPVQR